MICNILRIVSIIALFLPTVGSAADRALTKDGKHLFILSGQSNMRPPLPASFSETVSKIFGKDKVLVATLSRPSQPIKKWYKKWTPPEGIKAVEGEVYGELYDQLIKDVERTIKNEKLASVTYIWMQGEADAEAGWGAVYEKSFLGVLEQLKADLGIPEIHFVLGRINDYWLPETGIKDGEIVRKI
ncbi:MAG: sialate O-acetylesterase, partial [Planctomycetota bacterium]